MTAAEAFAERIAAAAALRIGRIVTVKNVVEQGEIACASFVVAGRSRRKVTTFRLDGTDLTAAVDHLADLAR